MAFRRWQIRVAAMIVGVGTTTASVASQDMPHRSTADIVRQQLGSIAGEIAGKLQLADKSAVGLSVQPSSGSGLVENAFVEALQHEGYRTFLETDRDSVGMDLVIVVLSSGAQYTQIGPATYVRRVRTELEARTQRRSGEAIAVLGMFQRAYSDTVSAKDAEVFVPRNGEAGDEEATLFQRLVGPLIVLASGIIIVYLFFTVRS
jgi:hypothetical protein